MLTRNQALKRLKLIPDEINHIINRGLATDEIFLKYYKEVCEIKKAIPEAPELPILNMIPSLNDSVASRN